MEISIIVWFQIEGLQSDTKQPKEDEPEIEPEDNAIEMPDDFDGKLQDLKKEEGLNISMLMQSCSSARAKKLGLA